jgi:hydrogenase expression/formation protein HypC
MCLAIPGQIVSIAGDDPLTRSARVSFGGVLKDINLAYLPDALVGEYVIVHAGFALSRIDEAEARTVFEYLDAIDRAAGVNE